MEENYVDLEILYEKVTRIQKRAKIYLTFSIISSILAIFAFLLLL